MYRPSCFFCTYLKASDVNLINYLSLNLSNTVDWTNNRAFPKCTGFWPSEVKNVAHATRLLLAVPEIAITYHTEGLIFARKHNYLKQLRAHSKSF